jgi:hypothetical protein
MSKVNMIDSAGNAFTTSLKKSREHIAAGTATLADAPKKVAVKKAPAKKAAKKAVAKRTYRTRALKAN